MIKYQVRAAGAVIGSAVDDALGAPFEFGPAGAFSARFPVPRAGEAPRGEAPARTEMAGGGGWEAGEATDDTQMAVLVADSLLARDGLDLPDVFARFRRWAASEPKDIGLQTEDVLTNGMARPLDGAAPRPDARPGRPRAAPAGPARPGRPARRPVGRGPSLSRGSRWGGGLARGCERRVRVVFADVRNCGRWC
ncbi:hypothetical protein GCM10009665_11000 [Kitasatospora nipponensis]|uniref:ADP-ribosylglycohydrolase n=1 Tax=Kitasatospora nipponensis TaxID=258049 RepID=A0ABN1VTF0_9ACTN